MPNVANVTTGKPKLTGSVFRAPIGTTLPTTVNATLDEAFKELGYAADDGVTNTNSPSSETIKAWGGDVVLTPQTEKPDTWKLKLIESLSGDLKKTIYGSENVSGDLASGLTVNAGSDEQEEASWVFDMIMRGGVAQRIVLPDAKITEIGDIVYKDDEPVGYEITLTAMPDSSGHTHYEYLKGPSGN